MAVYGQGDSRWLVEERQDGTNVNNWHWSEKDCMKWSEQRLSELFCDLVLTSGNLLQAKITSVESVQGECFLNVRKKKLIPSYELSIKTVFSGAIHNTDGSVLKEVTGKVLSCACSHKS